MFHAVTFNTLGGSLSGFFEWVFHYAWLYNIMHLSLEDLGYWIICKFSIYCHITIHIVKTSYLLISLLISLKKKKSESIRKPDIILQNTNFYLNAWILSLATNSGCCFPGQDKKQFIFQKTSGKYPSPNNHSLSLSDTFSESGKDS